MSEQAQAAAVIFECMIPRKGGSDIDMGDGKTICFRPNAEGQHVAVVSDQKHVARLMQIPDAYRMLGIVNLSVPHSPVMNLGAAHQAPVTSVPIQAAPEGVNAPHNNPVQPEKRADDATWPDLPVPDADGALSAEDDARLREIFKVEIGRPAPPKSKPGTMIAQIMAMREEKDRGGAA